MPPPKVEKMPIPVFKKDSNGREIKPLICTETFLNWTEQDLLFIPKVFYSLIENLTFQGVEFQNFEI